MKNRYVLKKQWKGWLIIDREDGRPAFTSTPMRWSEANRERLQLEMEHARRQQEKAEA